ncbi:MAG: hypothetical protein GXO32_06445 [Crenarchaeota archaeon]|nr:hypothetical protein [Thermoproteota archaeon]
MIWSRYERYGVKELLHVHLFLATCCSYAISRNLLKGLDLRIAKFVGFVSILASALHDVGKSCSFYQRQRAEVDEGLRQRMSFSDPPHEIVSTLLTEQLFRTVSSSRETFESWKQLKRHVSEALGIDLELIKRFVLASIASHHQGLRWWLNIYELRDRVARSPKFVGVEDLRSLGEELRSLATLLGRLDVPELRTVANIVEILSRGTEVLAQRGSRVDVCNVHSFARVFELPDISKYLPQVNEREIKRLASGIVMASDIIAVDLYVEKVCALHTHATHRSRYRAEMQKLITDLGIENELTKYLEKVANKITCVK